MDVSRSSEPASPRTSPEVVSRVATQARLALCVLTLAYVLSFIDRQLISLLVEPMKRDLRITDVQVSLLQGLAFASIYCLCGLPFGRAADQFSRRNIIMAGVGLWSLMTSLCGFAPTYTLLLLCRAGVGIGEASLSPSAYSMLSDYFPPRRLPAAMSFYNLGPAIGSGLAYMLGGGVIELASSTGSFSSGILAGFRPWQLAFALVGLLGTAVLALLLLVREPPRRLAPEDMGRTASFGETLRFLNGHRASLGMLFLGLSLLGVLGYATMTWYPTMLVRSFGQSVSGVGLTFGPVYVVASVIGNLVGGWGAVKMGDCNPEDPYVRWALCAAVMVSLGGIAVPLIPDLKATYLGAAILLLFQNAWMGAATAAVHLAVPNRMRALLTAILLFCTNIVGLILGPTAVAALTQYAFKDPAALRYSLSIVSLVAGVLSVLALWSSLRRFPELRGAHSLEVGARAQGASAR